MNRSERPGDWMVPSVNQPENPRLELKMLKIAMPKAGMELL
jgi:hypothetical protein